MAPRKADVDEAANHKITEKGIKWERSCTDVICCLLFTVFIVTIVGIGVYSMANGDPALIMTPYDSVGNQCGATMQGVDYVPANQTDFTAYPYKYFSGLEEYLTGGQNPLVMYYAVCVKECPAQYETLDCMTNGDTTDCPTAFYPTTVSYSYCFPTKEWMQDTGKAILTQMNNSDGGMAMYFLELQECWDGLIYMLIATFFISFIYIFLLKWITKPLLYISMIIILVAFVLLGFWCYMENTKYKEDEMAVYETTAMTEPIVWSNNYWYTCVGMYGAWVFAGLYAICICCCWKNISLGASIMEAASDFVSGNVRILILPVISYIMALIYFFWWFVTFVELYSIGEPEFQPNSFIANIKWSDEIWYAQWYNVFGMCWIIAFFICLQQFIIAACCCMWYFSGEGAGISDGPHGTSILKAIKWGAWYHLGSVSFGAFLIALITFIRIVFEYIAYQYEKVGNKDNAVYKAAACCIRCILWCLDQYVKFITKNAFIQIALQNKSFCTAAFESFYLMVRHAGRFSSAIFIGWIMMFLGKGTIIGSSTYLTMIYFQMMYPDLQQPLVPAVIIGLAAYLIGSLFLSIFSFSCTAILHCFILDEDTDGSKFTPESLKGFLDYNDQENAKKSNSMS